MAVHCVMWLSPDSRIVLGFALVAFHRQEKTPTELGVGNVFDASSSVDKSATIVADVRSSYSALLLNIIRHSPFRNDVSRKSCFALCVQTGPKRLLPSHR